MNESDIYDGMVFESTGANRTLRGHREIVVCSVYPGKLEATVNDLRTGRGWRMSLFTLANPKRWRHNGTNAGTTERASLAGLPAPESPSGVHVNAQAAR